MCLVTFAKKARFIKIILINLSQKIDNLFTSILLKTINHIKSSVGYKNKKQICYNQ